MCITAPVPASLSDEDLLAEVTRAATAERHATATLIALLAEVDARRAYLAEGCASLFTYCVERLHLSEHAAYHRIEAARAVRAFPALRPRLQDGSLTLTAVALLRPHLTAANVDTVLAAAAGQRKRAVEELVRRLAPLPDQPSSVRRLPARAHPASRASATPPAAADPAPRASTTLPSALHPVPRASVTPPSAPDLVSCTSPTPPAAAVSAALPTKRATSSSSPAPTDARVVEPERSLWGGAAAEDVAPGPAGAASAFVATLPAHAHAACAAPSRRAEVAPLAPDRYSLRVTLSAEGHAHLRRAQDLMRHTIPNGDAAVVVERALALLVERLERARHAATIRPARSERPPERNRPTRRRRPAKHAGPSATPARKTPSRHVPAAVKREVWARDQGCCAFVGTGGRCTETGGLEFHHRVPFADGGETTAVNLELRCRAHNAFEARRWGGEEANSVQTEWVAATHPAAGPGAP